MYGAVTVYLYIFYTNLLLKSIVIIDLLKIITERAKPVLPTLPKKVWTKPRPGIVVSHLRICEDLREIARK